MGRAIRPIARMAKPDPWTVIVVATCLRKKGPQYLGKTLLALDQAGAKNAWQRAVVCDGPLPPDCTWTALIDRKGPSGGCLSNLWNGLQVAATAGAERLIYFEDDIEICRNAVTHAMSLDIPDHLAFLDLCDFKEVSPGAPAGIYECELTDGKESPYHGTQGLVIPSRTVRYLLGQNLDELKRLPGIQHHANPKENRTPERMCDLIFGAALSRSPWPRYGAHIPCIVEHVGVDSCLYPTERLRKGRVATNYLGASFDALTL